MAVLLQYFFTSAFCWMLSEGVMLYMMLVTVFGNKFNRQWFFLILGWGKDDKVNGLLCVYTKLFIKAQQFQ